MSKLIVTIDGPAGSGKSTIAAMLARELDAVFLDTGAMYRAVTLSALNKGVNLKNENGLLKVFKETNFDFQPCHQALRVFIDNVEVTDDIRSIEVTNNAKYIASNSKLREELVKIQKQFAFKYQKIVSEGRDQGTIVFPDADFKFYLNADITERVKRRLNELKRQDKVSLKELKQQIQSRDESDSKRKVGPLRQADDAVEIDTTNMNQKQVVQEILEYINNVI